MPVRPRRRQRAFILTEVMAVMAIVAGVSGDQYAQAKASGPQTACVNNLRQIGQLLTMYTMESGHYPKAAFYPKHPTKDQQSIRRILGGDEKLWTCPGLPPKLQKTGLTFVYNDTIAGHREVPAKTWILVEFTCVSKRAPMPHPKGYNILYADGHVESTPKLPKNLADAQQAQLLEWERLHEAEHQLCRHAP